MLRGRGKKQPDPRRKSASRVDQLVSSPRGGELDVPMAMALGDLKDGPEKETVMVIWPELLKSYKTYQGEAQQFRELHEAETMKRSQLEMQLQEARQARERDARAVEVARKEMKRFYELAVSVAGTEEAVARLRRKYDDMQEAVLEAGRGAEDEPAAGRKVRIEEGGGSRKVPRPSHGSTGIGGATGLEVQGIPHLKNKALSKGSKGKLKEKNQQHNQAARLVNGMLNVRAQECTAVLLDPHRNYAKMFLDERETAPVERCVSAKQKKQMAPVSVPSIKSAASSGGRFGGGGGAGRTAGAVSPRSFGVARKSGVATTSPRKGAATLRSQLALGQLAAAGADDEDDEEEDEEDSDEDDSSVGRKSRPVAVTAVADAPRRTPINNSGLLDRNSSSAEDPPMSPGGTVLTGDGFAGLHTRKARARGAPVVTRRARTNSLVDKYEEGYEARLETMLRALKSKGDGRNDRIVSELLSTEEDYLHDLGITMSVFAKALRPIISEQQYRSIFSNLDQVHSVHIALLADLKTESFRSMEEQDWGGPFLKHANRLRAVYDVYTGNQAEGRKARASLEAHNATAAELLTQLSEKPECRNLNLQSYLIKPVQRICKYPLLLRELHKCFNAVLEEQPKASPRAVRLLDRLEEARSVMGAILESTNDQMVISDSHAVLVKLEEELNAPMDHAEVQLDLPQRQFIMSDTFLVVTRSGKKKEKPERLKCVLTTDCILVVGTGEEQTSPPACLRMVLPLVHLKVVDVADGALPDVYGSDANHIIELVSLGQDSPSSDVRFVLFCFSDAVKLKWMHAVAVGASFQRKLVNASVCFVCGSFFSSQEEHDSHTPFCEPPVSDEVSSADEVVRWLRAEPDRQKALELASKGLDDLIPAERKEWDSLKAMARSEKRRTIQLLKPGLLKDAAAATSLATSNSSLPPAPVRKGSTPPMRASPRTGSGSSSPRRGTTGASPPANLEKQSSDESELFVVYSATVSPRK